MAAVVVVGGPRLRALSAEGLENGIDVGRGGCRGRPRHFGKGLGKSVDGQVHFLPARPPRSTQCHPSGSLSSESQDMFGGGVVTPAKRPTSEKTRKSKVPGLNKGGEGSEEEYIPHALRCTKGREEEINRWFRFRVSP